MTKLVELRSGAARLRISPEMGGRVVDLRLTTSGGSLLDILAPFPQDARPEDLLRWPKGGIYPLVPYGNRIRGGELRFEGRSYKLPPHPDATPHTLHGHAHRVPWRLSGSTETAATWQLDHATGPEWPWPFRATVWAELSDSEAALQLRLENTGAAPMPAGFGLHPYFVHDPADVPSITTRIEWPVTPDYLAGAPRPHGGDAESGRRLPPGDVTFYRSGWDGFLSLQHPDGSTVEIRADPIFEHLVLHRPADAPYICIEPATHAPDGFNLAEDGVAEAGRIVLQPGVACEGTVRIALAR